MNTNLYKYPICGGPTNYSSINYQPQPCLHCCATLKLKPAEHGENQQAERIVQLEAALDAMVEGVARKTDSQQAERIRELEEQRKVMGFLVSEGTKELETEQAKSRELYAMLGHIVDWSPELPFYMKDEHKTLFRNALAAARELLSKCSVKEGK